MRRGACLVLGLAVMVVVCIFFPTSPTHAAKRLALVIGNNAYENVPALQKAVNDSEAISQELVKLGFAVVSAENVGRRAMSRALVELRRLPTFPPTRSQSQASPVQTAAGW